MQLINQNDFVYMKMDDKFGISLLNSEFEYQHSIST